MVTEVCACVHVWAVYKRKCEKLELTGSWPVCRCVCFVHVFMQCMKGSVRKFSWQEADLCVHMSACVHAYACITYKGKSKKTDCWQEVDLTRPTDTGFNPSVVRAFCQSFVIADTAAQCAQVDGVDADNSLESCFWDLMVSDETVSLVLPWWQPKQFNLLFVSAI